MSPRHSSRPTSWFSLHPADQPHGVTADAPPVAGTITPDRIRPGDLLFTARPSFLQEMCTRVAEPWRHVGLVTDGPDDPDDPDRAQSGLVLTEVVGPRFGARPLDQVLATSEAVAQARVAPAARPAARAAARWCLDQVDQTQVYAWDDVILAGFIAVTRRYTLPPDEEVLTRMVTAATARLMAQGAEVDQPSYTCSSFIFEAFHQAGHPLAFDLHQPRGRQVRPSVLELVRRRPRPVRRAAGSTISAAQFRNLTLALVRGVVASPGWGPTHRGAGVRVDPGSRTLMTELHRWATPGDAWRSPSLAERHFVALADGAYPDSTQPDGAQQAPAREPIG